MTSKSQENVYTTSEDFVRALATPQDFVRVLKAASDPLAVMEPSKIEIALKAWKKMDFYVPGKAEIIADWLLTKLLKEKDKDMLSNPIFDPRYWLLMSNLCESQDHTSGSGDVRSMKSWLTTILHRIPIGPIVVSFLESYNLVPANGMVHLADCVSTCLSVLWPISIQRMNVELLQQCFGAFTRLIPNIEPNDGISRIGKMISLSYHNSVTNSSNKKKLYQSFLKLYLCDWLRCLSTDYIHSNAALEGVILEGGIETLFNLDILRQHHDSSAEIPLVQTLSTFERNPILETIPELLLCYIRAIKRHRGALFGQGSQAQPSASLDELHESGMNFFTSMIGLVEDSQQDLQAWRTRVALLKIVNNENVFDRKQMNGQTSFKRILELASLSLHYSWKVDQLECTGLIVQCFSIVAHIDYDIVQPFISRLLPLLLQVPMASESHFAFLDILLSYHTKTRTMDVLLEAVLSAIAVHRTHPGDSREVYQTCSSSPIMHTVYLERLSRALQTFLTESQCLSTIQKTVGTLKDAWNHFYAASRHQEDASEVPKKKRKISPSSASESKDKLEELAVTYSLTCRILSVVLSSLPMTSLSLPTQEEVRQSMDTFRTDFLQHAISKSVKKTRKRGDSDFWSTEVSLAANLRLFYALNVSKNLSTPPQHDEKLLCKMIELVSDDLLLPELTLELFRVLLHNLRGSKHEDIISRLLQHLEKNFSPSDIHWSGHEHHLTRGEPGRAESALAMMHMIAERWLPDIDHLASTEQLERLLKFIMSIKLQSTPQSSHAMQPEQLLMQILHSSQFWELPNTQTVFMKLLSEMTSSLDPSKIKHGKTSSILKKVSVYQHLLLFPMEYFSWQLLDDLIQRSLAVDLALSHSSSSGHEQEIAEALVVLRVFLKRAYIYSGSIAQDSNNVLSEFLVHLVKDSTSDHSDGPSELAKATLDLVEIYFSKMLRASKKQGPAPILEVLTTYTTDLFKQASATSSRSFITLVNLLTSEFPQNSLPEEIPVTLRKLHQELLSAMLPCMVSVTESDTAHQEIKTHVDFVSGWYSLLRLEKWLESPDTSAALPLGHKLISKQMKALVSGSCIHGSDLEELCVTTFAILLQELDMQPLPEHSLQIDLIIASYISFSDALNHSSRQAMDLHFGKACKRIALEDYTYMLSLVTGSLSDFKHIALCQLPHIVHLAGLLLREHPTHSLVRVQKFATSCINIFTEHSVFVDGPLDIRLQVLEMLAQQCSNQPAALRSLDMAGLWLLLSKFLAPSQAHDDDTEMDILHKIVAILSSLIRLRRDLVVHSLPHLGMVLRRLLLCTRGCRPQLGARQTALVMHTQPRWIAAVRAVGVEEAKMLGRLLESLNTKTTVRPFPSASLSSTNPEARKAESLAKPFSKHAAYVLKAYIEAMNNPLCVLSLDVRKELQPGIFALCSMISEYSRDSLMVSALDIGGKAMLKILWKEYEKQRYIGKG